MKLSNHDELFPCSIETLSISHILGENRITTTNHLTFPKNTVFHVYYIIIHVPCSWYSSLGYKYMYHGILVQVMNACNVRTALNKRVDALCVITLSVPLSMTLAIFISDPPQIMFSLPSHWQQYNWKSKNAL